MITQAPTHTLTLFVSTGTWRLKHRLLALTHSGVCEVEDERGYQHLKFIDTVYSYGILRSRLSIVAYQIVLC
jgi:hypothetical protein